MDLKEFGLYFSKVREDSGFRSQRELADKSGVSHSTINRIESGSHRATPESLKQLAPFLKGVEYEDLLDKLDYIDSIPSSINDDLRKLPEVQFIMRAREKMSPKAYEKFLKLMKDAQKAFDEDDDD